MRRRDLLRIIALTPLAGRFAMPAAAAAREGNAVASYRAAIAALPFQGEAEAARLFEMAGSQLDLRAAWLVRRGGRSLDALIRGAKANTCDWGNAWTGTGFDTLMPLFSGCRMLARLATLRAKIAFDAGRNVRGLEDIVAALTMARHLGQGAVLIAQLVGIAIEHVAIDVAAGHLLRLDPPTLRRFASRIDALPTTVGPADAIRAERAFFLGVTVPGEPDVYPAWKVATILPFYDRLIEAVEAGDVAEAEAIRSDPALDDDLRGSFASFDACQRAIELAEMRRALLRAAIEVAADGPDAIGRVLDPFDGLPFLIQPRVGGFVLESRYQPAIPFPPGLKVGPRLVVGAA